MADWQNFVMVGVMTSCFLALWIWALVRSKPGRGMIDAKDRHGPERRADEH
jgi:hypothetical protein